MTRPLRALLLVALTTCTNRAPQCPDVSYTPVGTPIAAVSECPADACPLRCGDGKVCTRDDALTCEGCADLLTYMAEHCTGCYLEEADGLFQLDCWQ